MTTIPPFPPPSIEESLAHLNSKCSHIEHQVFHLRQQRLSVWRIAVGVALGQVLFAMISMIAWFVALAVLGIGVTGVLKALRG